MECFAKQFYNCLQTLHIGSKEIFKIFEFYFPNSLFANILGYSSLIPGTSINESGNISIIMSIFSMLTLHSIGQFKNAESKIPTTLSGIEHLQVSCNY